jgi:1-phosphofructokinase family hexose kinase
VTAAAPTLLCIVPNPSIDKTVEVPVVTPGTIHRPEAVVAVPGGKGLNVARAAATLGVPVHAVLVLGGHAGRWMTAELRRRDIAWTATWVRGETRTCLSVLDRSSGTMTEVYEPGPTIAAAEWRRFVASAARVADEAPAGSVAAISGSFPRGAPDDAATELLAALGPSGVRWLVDMSGPHLSAALKAHPALVKVNADEASSVLERPIVGEGDAIDAARGLVERGAELAIVTRGADGAVAADARRAWVVEPLAGGGPFSVGSGDAFLAGFAAGLLADASADRCLRLATGAAAANTRTPGAGELDAETASRLAAAVRIRPAG